MIDTDYIKHYNYGIYDHGEIETPEYTERIGKIFDAFLAFKKSGKLYKNYEKFYEKYIFYPETSQPIQ